MTAFTHEAGTVYLTTALGPLALTKAEQEAIAGFIHRQHDVLMSATVRDRLGAKRLRKLGFQLIDAEIAQRAWVRAQQKVAA